MAITAIFGGTFNPFHIGHYEMLKALQNNDNIEKIFLMPDRIPPHKVSDFMYSDELRIKMCQTVAEDFSKAEVCLIEFERQGKSYTYDTVLELKAKYPEKEFSFVCGGDMFVYLEKWYKYEELLKEIPFIVFRRTDTSDSEFDFYLEKFLKTGINITVLDNKIPHVSSTEIRKNLKLSERLLPKKVFELLNSEENYVG